MSTVEPAAVPHQRLHSSAPVRLAAAACLPLRSRYSDCRRCVDTCPAGFLQLDEQTLSLVDGCLGCGRCAAACPTGALAVDGFALPEAIQPSNKTVTVDCWKVPAPTSGADMRVPCLGGLDVNLLLSLYLRSGEHAVYLLDRGGCGDCPAGRGAHRRCDRGEGRGTGMSWLRLHPAAAALSVTREWLASLSVPEERLPRLEPRPLPRTAMRRDTPNAREEQPIARRAFFRRLGGELAETLQLGDAAPRAAALTGQRPAAPSLARERLRMLLEIIAARRHRPVPSHFYPAVTIGTDCRHHALCAALCPTAALQVVTADGGAGIVFDANACIACGQCEHACPGQALKLLPQGDGSRPTTPRLLTRHPLRECADCGGAFTGGDRETLCPTCRKSRAFAQAGFEALFADPPNNGRRRGL